MTCRELTHFLAEEISWSFTTEFAPWKGGFYERSVGLVKRAFNKAIGRNRFSYEEFSTLTAKVEAMLNTRPLTYVQSDSSPSVVAITPNHFLAPMRHLSTGIDSVPQDQETESGARRDPVANLTALQRRRQVMLDTFWKLWHKDYLLSLCEQQLLHHRTRRSIFLMWLWMSCTFSESWTDC